MKKAFTLIELIFVIVLIGLLSIVAIPKFQNLAGNSKKTVVKSTVSSILGAVDNIHGEWVVNDNYHWQPVHGDCNLSDAGYPQTLDENKTNLFECVLKIPIKRCGDNKNGCFDEESQNEYKYYFSPSKALKFRYDSTTGSIICEDNSDEEYSEADCNATLFGK